VYNVGKIVADGECIFKVSPGIFQAAANPENTGIAL
jgi:hypothetical protein